MTEQRSEIPEYIRQVAVELGVIAGIRAVVLGGSRARGQAREESDYDLGLLYADEAPPDLEGLRRLAARLNDAPGPIVSELYGWGPWVNGGAWLTIQGQRVDWLYRSLDQIERVIAQARTGEYVLDAAQQPPFGFLSLTYLGELSIARPLYDPEGLVPVLREQVEVYPEALRTRLIQEQLWAAEFGLTAFATKFAARGDVSGTVACLSRAMHQLTLVLFALNRSYLLNDKSALTEASAFARTPLEFKARVTEIFCDLRPEPELLTRAISQARTLWDEVATICEGLYQPRYAL